VLTSIAYPSYQQYIIKANRASAQQFLLRAVSTQHQFLLANNGNSYANEAQLIGLSGLLSIPIEVSTHYTIDISSTSGASPPTFRVTATPIINSMQSSDGPLMINDVGSKSGNW
jgi:type IV pilus assembly protein PilE